MTVPEWVGQVRGYHKRQEQQWAHTRYLAAVLININRDPKSPAVMPEKIMPLSFDKKITEPKAPKRVLDAEYMKALEERYRKT